MSPTSATSPTSNTPNTTGKTEILNETVHSAKPANPVKHAHDPAVDPHARFMIVAVITVGAFVALLNQTVMSPALPALMRDFAIGTGTVQWVTSIYMLVSGIMVPISGYLIDRFPTRRLFAGALGAFVAGTILCALSPAFGPLIAGRILQAAGSGVLLPLVAVVPMLVYPPERRGTAMGMAGIVMAAGPAIGPVVGGLVIDSYGWRPMFWGVAALALIILTAGGILLRDVGTVKHPKLDVPSVILSTVAFGGLLYGFSNASTQGWTNLMVIVPILMGAVCCILFLRRQTTLEEPLLRVRTLRIRDFRSSAILVTLINASVAATNVTLPIFIQNVLDQSATVTGMVMLPAAAIGIIMSPVSGMLFDKHGPRGVGIGGLALMTLSLGMLATISTGTPVWFVALFCMLQATGQALANMPINTWGVNALDNDMIAQGNAIANTGRQIAAAIATALLITVETNTAANHATQGIREATGMGIARSYLLCAAIALAALITCVLTVKPTKHHTTPETTNDNTQTAAPSDTQSTATTTPPAEPATDASPFALIREQRVADIMETNPYSVTTQANVATVVATLVRLKVSSLPIVDDTNHVVGFISDGDILRAIATYNARSVQAGDGSSLVVFDDESLEEKVSQVSDRNIMDIATRKTITIDLDEKIGVAARTLAQRQFKKLPVTDEEGHLMGVIRRKSIISHAFSALFNA